MTQPLLHEMVPDPRALHELLVRLAEVSEQIVLHTRYSAETPLFVLNLLDSYFGMTPTFGSLIAGVEKLNPKDYSDQPRGEYRGQGLSSPDKKDLILKYKKAAGGLNRVLYVDDCGNSIPDIRLDPDFRGLHTFWVHFQHGLVQQALAKGEGSTADLATDTVASADEGSFLRRTAYGLGYTDMQNFGRLLYEARERPGVRGRAVGSAPMAGYERVGGAEDPLRSTWGYPIDSKFSDAEDRERIRAGLARMRAAGVGIRDDAGLDAAELVELRDAAHAEILGNLWPFGEARDALIAHNWHIES